MKIASRLLSLFSLLCLVSVSGLAQSPTQPTPSPNAAPGADSPAPVPNHIAPLGAQAADTPPAPAPSIPASSDAPVTDPNIPAPPPQPKFGLPAKPASAVEQDFIGHRYNEPEDTGGWGWVKLPEQSWKKAVWVTLRETPGIAIAPWRALGKRDADQDYEYRIHGYFAPYKVYDPHTDEMLNVLVIESVAAIDGATPAKPLDLTPGPEERKPHSVRSSFRSREF